MSVIGAIKTVFLRREGKTPPDQGGAQLGKPKENAMFKSSKSESATQDSAQDSTPSENHGSVNDRNAIKKLRWLIKTPPTVPFMKIVVTPYIAEEALKYLPPEDGPFRQRPYAPSTGEKYAKLMRLGQFRETLVPIIFTRSEFLGDGQHRMRAIVLAGATLPFWFAFGDKDENFFVYDNNKVRGAGDIFAIKGVPNHAMASATAKWVAAYEAETFHAGSNAFDMGIGTPEQTYRFYCERPGIQDSMRIGHAMAHNRMPSPSLMAALHYIASQKQKDQADKFFMKLATGLGFEGRRDPAYQLREYIAKSPTTIIGRELAVLAVDAWNAARARKGFKAVFRDTNGRFPRMI